MEKRTAENLFGGKIHWPLHLDPPLPALAKPVILNVMPTGSFITRAQNPAQPYTAEENARAAIAAYREGAAIWHMHIRDERGIPCKDPERIRGALDQVLEACPDLIISMNALADYNATGVGNISPIVEPLIRANPRYIDTVVVHTESSRNVTVEKEDLKDMVVYLQERGIKPEFECVEARGIHNIRAWVLNAGVDLKQPYFINCYAGSHKGTPLDFGEAWAYRYALLMMESFPEHSVRGVNIGGRLWMPLSLFMIMLGADHVRIGMEEAVYFYPHKNELIENNAQMIATMVSLCRALGREVATPKAAREILGLRALPR